MKHDASGASTYDKRVVCKHWYQRPSTIKATVRAKIYVRKKLLTDNLDNWGSDHTRSPECYALAEKSWNITAAKYDRWVSDCATKKKYQEEFTYTVNQLYKNISLKPAR